ncbi:MAG: hypothetical protein HN334_02245 [Candidatus Cloacimonetes bacterium]|jgi:hypothetical protein|nr:hypothetical protein [Candidatus Cloacimonadota bacterium]
MPEQTIEYCSLHYLNQWITKDHKFCIILSNGNKEEKIQALKEAGNFYGIARNLPLKYDVKKGIQRYKPVLDIIDNVNLDYFKENPIKKIIEIEGKISKQYGDRGVLSLTTKFLWLKIQHPVIIYDSQAKNALGLKTALYESYYEKWLCEFLKRENEIKEKCEELAKIHKYAITYQKNTKIDIGKNAKKYIKKISSEKWFHERVFDIYLWHKGK